MIAWRKDLDRRHLAAGSIRRKLSALSSLYEFLTDQNAVPTNPVKGVKRPKVDSYEGKTLRPPSSAARENRTGSGANRDGQGKLPRLGDGLGAAPEARLLDRH